LAVRKVLFECKYFPKKEEKNTRKYSEMFKTSKKKKKEKRKKKRDSEKAHSVSFQLSRLRPPMFQRISMLLRLPTSK